MNEASKFDSRWDGSDEPEENVEEHSEANEELAHYQATRLGENPYMPYDYIGVDMSHVIVRDSTTPNDFHIGPGGYDYDGADMARAYGVDDDGVQRDHTDTVDTMAFGTMAGSGKSDMNYRHLEARVLADMVGDTSFQELMELPKNVRFGLIYGAGPATLMILMQGSELYRFAKRYAQETGQKPTIKQMHAWRCNPQSMERQRNRMASAVFKRYEQVFGELRVFSGRIAEADIGFERVVRNPIDLETLDPVVRARAAQDVDIAINLHFTDPHMQTYRKLFGPWETELSKSNSEYEESLYQLTQSQHDKLRYGDWYGDHVSGAEYVMPASNGDPSEPTLTYFDEVKEFTRADYDAMLARVHDKARTAFDATIKGDSMEEIAGQILDLPDTEIGQILRDLTEPGASTESEQPE